MVAHVPHAARLGIKVVELARCAATLRLPWSEEEEPPGSQRVPKGTARARKDRDARNKGISTTQTLVVFAVAWR